MQACVDQALVAEVDQEVVMVQEVCAKQGEGDLGMEEVCIELPACQDERGVCSKVNLDARPISRAKVCRCCEMCWRQLVMRGHRNH